MRKSYKINYVFTFAHNIYVMLTKIIRSGLSTNLVTYVYLIWLEKFNFLEEYIFSDTCKKKCQIFLTGTFNENSRIVPQKFFVGLLEIIIYYVQYVYV